MLLVRAAARQITQRGWQWMGKRSDFERVEKDAYQTFDPRAVAPLKAHLGIGNLSYYEPCVGEGKLVELLKPLKCVGASDEELDARTTQYKTDAEYFITNPPWSRDLLHPIIENLRTQLPTWLLFDADWMHTRQSAPYMKYCEKIISVGRVRWIPGTKVDGKDNTAWYLFIKYKPLRTEFIGRQVNERRNDER